MMIRLMRWIVCMHIELTHFHLYSYSGLAFSVQGEILIIYVFKKKF
jgi:hypothetical protein